PSKLPVGWPETLSANHEHSQIPTALKSTAHAANAELEGRSTAPAEAGSARNNGHNDAGSNDKDESAKTATLPAHDFTDEKAESFSQAITPGKDMAASATTIPTHITAPVSSGAETTNASPQRTDTHLPATPTPTAPLHVPEFNKVVSDAQLAQSSAHSEMR